MARYPNESCMKVCFIFWIIISCGFASTSAYFAYLNQIEVGVQGVSDYVFGWINTWLTATSWTCLFCGILGPTVITMAFLIEVRAAACFLGTLLLILFCTPSFFLYGYVHFGLRPMVYHHEPADNQTFLPELTNKSKIELMDGMFRALDKYVINTTDGTEGGIAGKAWDNVQRKYECCGVNGIDDWQLQWIQLREAETEQVKPYDEYARAMPVSCCAHGFQVQEMMIQADCYKIRTEGCYPKVLEIVEKVVVKMELRSLIGLSLMACWGGFSVSLSFFWLCVTITAEMPNQRKKRPPKDVWEPATTPPIVHAALIERKTFPTKPQAASNCPEVNCPEVSRLTVDNAAEWA